MLDTPRSLFVPGASRSAYDSVVSEGGTRKRVRRPATKRVTGKEGSPHEEEWLVTTMRGLIPSEKLLGDQPPRGPVPLHSLLPASHRVAQGI